jgi:hypothetical protein
MFAVDAEPTESETDVDRRCKVRRPAESEPPPDRQTQRRRRKPVGHDQDTRDPVFRPEYLEKEKVKRVRSGERKIEKVPIDHLAFQHPLSVVH